MYKGLFRDINYPETKEYCYLKYEKILKLTA